MDQIEKLKSIQGLLGMGDEEFDKAIAELIKSKSVEVRVAAAVKAQEAGITDAKIMKWIFTGKYE